MSAKARLALDAALLLAFVAAYNPVATGIPAHIWLSLAIILPTLLHLSLNWEWAVYAASRLMGRLRRLSRIQFSIDAALFFSLVVCTVSGIVVTPGLGTSAVLGAAPAIWYVAHSVSADATTMLLAVHLAMHWRWITGVVRRTMAAETAARPARTRTSS